MCAVSSSGCCKVRSCIDSRQAVNKHDLSIYVLFVTRIIQIDYMYRYTHACLCPDAWPEVHCRSTIVELCPFVHVMYGVSGLV